MQYTSGVSIQTDATGTPVGINVAGTHAANAGYVVWDETFYAAFGTAKTNAAGLSATGFGVDGKYSSWLQGIASFLNTDGSPNTALGELFVKGDFHFNTNFAGRTEVPEPFTAALLGSALLGGCALRRKKQSI